MVSIRNPPSLVKDCLQWSQSEIPRVWSKLWNRNTYTIYEYNKYTYAIYINPMKTGIGQWKYCIPQPFSRCLISLCSSLFDFNSINTWEIRGSVFFSSIWILQCVLRIQPCKLASFNFSWAAGWSKQDNYLVAFSDVLQGPKSQEPRSDGLALDDIGWIQIGNLIRFT